MGSNKVVSTLNCWYTYGKGDEVIMTIDNEIKKVIIDKDGRIVNFPGIIMEDTWADSIGEGSTSPYVNYRSEFSRNSDGNWMMIWQIQPDGRYWADEGGYGGCSDCEINLYSYFDNNGNFLAPFRIFSMGTKSFLTD